MKSQTRNLFFAFGLIAVIVMLFTFDVSFAQLWEDICHAGYWLIAILGLWVLLYLMNAWTWRIIIRGSGPCPIPFWKILKLTITGFALNYATPAGLMGGEPYKIMELKPYIGTQRATSSVLLFAMMHIFAHFWFWASSIVVYLTLATSGLLPIDTGMTIVLLFMAIFCGAGIYLFLRGYRNGMVVRLIHLISHIPGLRRWGRQFATNHQEDLQKIDHQISQLQSQNKRSFYGSFALEYVGRVLQSFEIFFMLLLFHAHTGGVGLTFVHAFLILSFTSLFANLLFFLPLQLGGREGGFAMSVAQMGMTADIGLFVSIICRFRELVWTSIGLLLMKVGNQRCPTTTFPTTQRVFSIFHELNQIPRPSHHEQRVADYLCQFAERLHLEYQRDAENCVVIRKPASPGHEAAEPIVLLNHMDMVCVGMSDPLTTPIEAYVEDGWMKARGTSLGADNGIGLSMALAVLEDDSILHPALEVITTTNEEDGMTGAAALSNDFIRGRKVINLDSEDYDTITTGAAGACLQFHRIPIQRMPAPTDGLFWYRICIEGGLGGHSGVDIHKGRCSAVIPARHLLKALCQEGHIQVAHLQIGEANASIASKGELVLCGTSDATSTFVQREVERLNQWLSESFGSSDPHITCRVEPCEPQATVLPSETMQAFVRCLEQIPQGVVQMSQSMHGTVETSNNVGRILTATDHIFVSTHTRSFLDREMDTLSHDIAQHWATMGAATEVVMSAPAWQENQQSPFLQLVSDTFLDVLGWRPRKVAMHFVLEAGFFVQHYPGLQMASIGPRIVEPHSVGERVELKTIDDIWQVLLELLKRLS